MEIRNKQLFIEASALVKQRPGDYAENFALLEKASHLDGVDYLSSDELAVYRALPADATKAEQALKATILSENLTILNALNNIASGEKNGYIQLQGPYKSGTVNPEQIEIINYAILNSFNKKDGTLLQAISFCGRFKINTMLRPLVRLHQQEIDDSTKSALGLTFSLYGTTYSKAFQETLSNKKTIFKYSPTGLITDDHRAFQLSAELMEKTEWSAQENLFNGLFVTAAESDNEQNLRFDEVSLINDTVPSPQLTNLSIETNPTNVLTISNSSQQTNTEPLPPAKLTEADLTAMNIQLISLISNNPLYAAIKTLITTETTPDQKFAALKFIESNDPENRATLALLKVCADTNENLAVRFKTIVILGQKKDPRAIPTIKSLLEHPNLGSDAAATLRKLEK